MCGWLKDKYGVSWQIVPEELAERLSEPHSPAQERMMTAVFAMKKLDIATLRAAYDG